MDTLLQDIRFAWRSLGRSRGFTTVVLVVMGLGIGVNAMVFSMVYGFLGRTWPLPGFERVMTFEESVPKSGDDQNWVPYRNFLDLRDRLTSFETVGGFYDVNALVVIDRDPERFYGACMSANAFDALGVRPVLGRVFNRDEEVFGQNWNALIVSHRIWKERLGGGPDAIGRTVRINGRVREVVGVMPEGFGWPEFQDFWIPLAVDPSQTLKRDDNIVRIIARLKPGVSLAQARAELGAAYAQLRQEHPVELEDRQVTMMSYMDAWRRGPRPLFIMILSAVVLVLLIACANVANLMLARTAARRREIGVRMALGAGRGRVVRQLLTESLMLALAGAVIGVVLAHWGNGLWAAAIPMEKPFFLRFELDAPVLGFVLLVTLFAAVASGLSPAMHATDRGLSESMREGTSQGGRGRSGQRFRNALIVAEVAMSLVLLIGAGLMIRSFQRVTDQEGTIDARNVLTATLILPVASFPSDSAKRLFCDEAMQALPALPGVTRASLTSSLPLNRNNSGRRVHAETGAHDHRDRGLRTQHTEIYPGYFAALGLELRSGRDFEWSDGPDAPPVLIVNESLAEALWPGEDPIGKRVTIIGDEREVPWRTVVGVARTVAQNVEFGEHNRCMFVPHRQSPGQVLTWVVRAEGDPTALAGPLREFMRQRAPDLPLYDVRTFREHVEFSLWVRRLFMGLMGTFSVIALLIAGVGLYGVMAYSVAQRTQEIGVRMALGAARAQVLRMVMSQAMRLTILGAGIGFALAFAVTRFMASLLFDVSPTDPPTFAVVGLILAVSSALAAAVPAWRATRVDPMVALRYE